MANCRHAKGGICTNVRNPDSGIAANSATCDGCRFSEAPGEKREYGPAPCQLAQACPPGAVLCGRCQRPCRTGPPDPKAQMLRQSATGGFCIDCAVTDWLRSTYPVNLLLRAAPMLGTDAAVRDQLDWDADGDWGIDSFSLDHIREREQRIGSAVAKALHGDNSELDGLCADRQAREDRRVERQLATARKRPEMNLLIPAIREQFEGIMRVAFAQAKPDEINWQWIVDNWALPFPPLRGKRRKRGATWP